jgi:hypothetical protein
MRVKLRIVCPAPSPGGRASPRAAMTVSNLGTQFNPWYTDALGSGHDGSRRRDPSPRWVRQLPHARQLNSRNRGCTGRWGVGENQSRRDPAKVAQYPAAAGLGKRF